MCNIFFLRVTRFPFKFGFRCLITILIIVDIEFPLLILEVSSSHCLYGLLEQSYEKPNIRFLRIKWQFTLKMEAWTRGQGDLSSNLKVMGYDRQFGGVNLVIHSKFVSVRSSSLWTMPMEKSIWSAWVTGWDSQHASAQQLSLLSFIGTVSSFSTCMIWVWSDLCFLS